MGDDLNGRADPVTRSAVRAVGLLSLSQISDDPRVRRQGDAFSRAGWNVVGVGLGGAVSSAPDWRQLALPAGPVGRLGAMPRAARAAKMLAVRAGGRFADDLYWTSASPYGALCDLAATVNPDLWLANDWTVLPIAQRLARAQKVPFVYDSHELASDEHAEHLRWRLLNRPMIVALEREGLRQAALVTCVSDGIADRLQEQYGLRERPLVVRNTPEYREVAHRPTGERVEILYHGLVAPGRGLVECIRSVAQWREEFRLTIRGPADAGYLDDLRREIDAAGIEARVSIAPPVPMTGLVREAASFDVGLFALPDHSRHNHLALPNKIFEYAMAGLALCVSDLPEIARLVRAHDLGVLISGTTPAAIAAVVNRLTREAIDGYKAKALLAARSLNWEKESEMLLIRCTEIVGRIA